MNLCTFHKVQEIQFILLTSSVGSVIINTVEPLIKKINSYELEILYSRFLICQGGKIGKEKNMINGAKIKARLDELGMTQRELAEEIGVTDQMVSYIIQGKRIPGGDKLISIAVALGCSLDDIVIREERS